MNQPLRRQVLYLYKELIYMGKDYPAGYDFFIKKLRKAFRSKSTLTAQKDIQKGIDLGEFVKKELVALYSLKKYRFLKKNYYDIEKGIE